MKQKKLEHGQSTTEYALLLLLVGGVVVAALAWLGRGVLTLTVRSMNVWPA